MRLGDVRLAEAQGRPLRATNEVSRDELDLFATWQSQPNEGVHGALEGWVTTFALNVERGSRARQATA